MTGKRCAVYVIGRREGISASKIGVSEAPERRVRSLQCGSPRRLFLAREFWLENREEASELESAVHLLLREHRMSGEWFALTPEKCAFMVRVAIRLNEQPPCPTKIKLIEDAVSRIEAAT